MAVIVIRVPRIHRLFRAVCAAVILVALTGRALLGQDGPEGEVRDDHSLDNVLEEFEVAKNGDLLLLPVQFNDGKTYQFMVDTGHPTAAVDLTLKRYLKATGETALIAGRDEPMYSFRDASIGRLRIPPQRDVECRDMSGFSEASGYDLRGILGMQFLRRYVVDIDFDAGRLAF